MRLKLAKAFVASILCRFLVQLKQEVSSGEVIDLVVLDNDANVAATFQDIVSDLRQRQVIKPRHYTLKTNLVLSLLEVRNGVSAVAWFKNK